jgi:hypothetical protein
MSASEVPSRSSCSNTLRAWCLPTAPSLHLCLRCLLCSRLNPSANLAIPSLVFVTSEPVTCKLCVQAVFPVPQRPRSHAMTGALCAPGVPYPCAPLCCVPRRVLLFAGTPRFRRPVGVSLRAVRTEQGLRRAEPQPHSTAQHRTPKGRTDGTRTPHTFPPCAHNHTTHMRRHEREMPEQGRDESKSWGTKSHDRHAPPLPPSSCLLAAAARLLRGSGEPSVTDCGLRVCAFPSLVWPLPPHCPSLPPAPPFRPSLSPVQCPSLLFSCCELFST